MSVVDDHDTATVVQLGPEPPSRFPRWLTPALWIAAPSIVFFILCGVLLHVAAGRLLDPLKPLAQMDYAGVGFKMNGNVEFEKLTLKDRSPSASADDQVTIERLVLRTPGLLWLARSLFADSGAAVDSWRVGLNDAGSGFPEMDEVHVEAFGIESIGEPFQPLLPWWIGLSAAAPFDAMGCGSRKHWAGADLTNMHLPDAPSHLVLTAQVTSDTTVEIAGNLSRPETSSFEFKLDLTLPQATRMLDTAPANMRVSAFHWKVDDNGFIVRRNSMCAGRSKMSKREFVNRHMVGVQRRLIAFGAVPAEEVQDTYRDYAENGGVLSFKVQPNAPLLLSDWERLPPAERLSVLNASLTAGTHTATPLAMTFIEPVSGGGTIASSTYTAPASPFPVTPSTTPSAPPAHPVTPPPVTPTPVTPVTPAPVKPEPIAATPVTPPTTPAKPAASPSVPPLASATPLPSTVNPPTPAKPATPTDDSNLGEAVPTSYKALEKAVGKTIRVRTIYNTVRQGVLTKYNRAAIEMEVDEKGEKITLSLPRSTLRGAEIIGNG